MCQYGFMFPLMCACIFGDSISRHALTTSNLVVTPSTGKVEKEKKKKEKS